MKRFLNILRMLLVCIAFTTTAYAQPTNDACVNAIPLTVGVGTCDSTLYTNVAATAVGEPATPACWNPTTKSHSVWFSFVATFADILVSTNFVVGSLTNTQAAVYSGACGGLTLIGCQENINTATGQLNTNITLHGLTVGNTYYILVDGNGNATGDFGVCVQQTSPPGPPLPTQECSGAQTLCSLSTISVPDGLGDFGSTNEWPSCFGNPGERSSNWYTFTAATTGTLNFSIMPNSIVDYDFAVYNTTNSCPGVEEECNWSDVFDTEETGMGCGDLFQCEPALNVIAGQTYTILVDRYTPANSSGFTMTFSGSASFLGPNPSFTNTTACLGTATQFTNTTAGNFTYDWNFGDGTTSHLENPTHTYASAGSYNVTLLITALPGGCQNSITKIVTVTAYPTVDAGIGGSVCPAGCINLSGSTNATGQIVPVSFSNINDFNIPDGSATGVSSPITITGISPTIISATSIASVCLNIQHDYDDDLDIYLECPDGTRIQLSTDNGGSDDNYSNTCFSPIALSSITTGTAPFNGTYLPEQSFNVLNGCTANGVWRLFVQDDAAVIAGTIQDWTITFNNGLPPFTWSPTTAMTNSTTLTPTVCPSATTSYTLTANTNGCISTDSVTINHTTTIRPVITCGILTPTSVQFKWNDVNAISYTVSYQINSNPIINAGNIGNLQTVIINALTPGDVVTITVTPIGGAGTCFGSQTFTCATSNCFPPAVPTIATTAPTCAANGFTTITNYNAANLYIFSPTGPTAGAGGTITGAVIGTAYTITSTSGGCTSSSSAAFTNLIRLTTPAVPTVSTTAPTCATNGFTSITNYNAANTYTFSPTGPTAGAGGTITGATIGTAYTITATSGGCTSAASASFTNQIRLTTPAVPTVSTTAPTCIADGFTTITNYNGSNTYTFSPAGPTAGIGGAITGAVIGTAYTITASTGGCTSAASTAFTNVIMLPTPSVPTVFTTAPTCAANGFTSITNYNAANTYTFSPTGPTAGAGGTITGATIGTAYTITARNGSCTSAASTSFTNQIRLTTPAVPTVSTTVPTCIADGFTTITNYNGANTYTFSPTGPTTGVSGAITGAVIGTTYTITASTGGCTSAASTAFTNLIMLPTPAVPTVSTTAPTCTANGFTTITNYSASNVYTFSPAGPTAGAGGTITGATIGTAYTITARNGGCTSVASMPFTNLIRLTTPAFPTRITTAPTCSADGFTTITNYNGANTYTFSPTGPTAGTGGTINGAVIGTQYTMTASSGGCTSVTSVPFTNLAMLATPTVPTVLTTAPTCAADGFTSITNYNAANTYTFSPAGPTAGAGGTITGATIGTAYTITARNGGCTSAASATFTNLIRLTTPAVPTVSTTAPTCAADGFTMITNYNGANTYTFSPTGPTAGAGGTITGANLGTAYTITATSGGCTSAASSPFTNFVMLVNLVAPTLSTTAPTCTANGFTTITNYNPTYTYIFSPTGPTVGVGGVIAGAVIGTAYTVSATQGLCISPASVAFTNLIRLTTPAIPTVSTTAPTCIANGFTTITNYNAANTYIFTPTGPTAGAGGTITGAMIGTAYTITATSGGCTSAASAAFTNVIMLVTPTAPTVATTAPTCAANGFTIITNYNTANTYTFSPAGPTAGTGGTITGAVVGTAYTITATSGGCTSSPSAAFTNLIRLTTPAVPTVSTASPTCIANGFTTITNYNAANTYTFSPNGPTAGAGGIITGAIIGTPYTITATSGGCTSSSSTAFTNAIMLATPVAPTTSTTAPTCTVDGSTIITNYSAANTYTFSPTGPTTSTGGIITGATIGTAYTITSTSGGCTSVASIPFTNLIRIGIPAVPLHSTTAPTCFANGFTTITNYDPTVTYTFIPTGPTVNAGGLITGTTIGTGYTVTSTKNGCTSSASVSFTNFMMLATPAAPTLSTTPPTCYVDGFSVVSNYNPAHTYAFSPAGPTVGLGGSITGAITGTTYTVTATAGGCTSAASAPFTNAPLLFNINTTSPAPLHYCDPNNDGFGTFDLTQVIPLIIGTNPYTLTIHETPTDAQIAGAAIPNINNYDNIDVDDQIVYIRVADNVNGCFAVIPLQLIVDRTPEATEPQDYHVCDDDTDGSALFNLTSVASEVFGTINQATHTISFYTSLGDAQSGTNAITNLISFPSSGQTIWIRVENTITGCSDIVTLKLIVDPLPLATQPNYPQYSLCDVTAPLGYEEFNLGSKINAILLNQTGVNVSFHFSQADAAANIAPLPLLYTNVVPFVQTIWIRIENANTQCFVLSTIDIRVEPLPTPIPPNQVYTICDNNQDGYGTFNLNSLTADILQGANYTISYHETYDDAQYGNNVLVSPYDNVTPFVQFIYVLAVDNVNGCRSVIPIELNVDPQPVTPFTVPNLTQCDEDANPQNGSMLFDLTQNDTAVLSIQTSPAIDFTVTYHVSQSDATAGFPVIVQSANYVGTDNETIWVRVENNATGCFSIGSFQLFVNAPLALPIPTPLSVCDADAIVNNQFTEFDLTVKNNEITGGQNVTVTYYPSYPVTASSVAIPNPAAYTNILPAVQTLGVMVTTAQGCRSYTSLDIRVLPIPTPNLAGIRPLAPQCDVNNTGDMMEIFDLTVNATNILNGDNTLTLHYFPSQPDALAGTNEILSPTTALVGQNVWIRVENTRVDYLSDNCFVLIEQPLTVNPLPEIIQPMSFEVCDDDTDGSVMTDLTTTTASLLAAGQLASDFTITYHNSAANAQAGTNAIQNPTQFTNQTNPQIIYIRVVNNATGCVNYNGQFTLKIHPQPNVNIPANFDTCDTDGTNDGFFALDLSTYINSIIGTQVGVTATFYDTQNDAWSGTNPITDLVNYQTYTHTIWIRVEDNVTGCYNVVPFVNTVEELSEPNITSPSDTICVQYGTNILLSGITLDSGITNPNYTFEWFEAANPTSILGTGSTYTINTVAPGDYTVVATSTSPLGCVSNPSNVFTVIQSGPAQFATPPYTVSNAFDDNQVIAINVEGFGLYEYSLDDGPFQSSNIFENVSLGEHTITVKDVKGSNSCGEVSLDGIQTINYPHYFTPNGDGYNDTWNVVGLQNQLGTKLYIFDRYGKLLKQISTGGEGWDGTFNGHALPSTDYWFKIEYLEQSKVKEFKAHFSLKR